MANETRKYLSVREVAQRLGLERKTVYRLILSGDLPAAKIGKSYRIHRDDLEAFFEAQKRQVGAHREEKGPSLCSFCGAPLLGTLDVGGYCRQCGAALCTTCWSLRGTQLCREHSLPGPTPPEHVLKVRSEMPLICSACRKVIPHRERIGGTCQAEGCQEPLCQECWDRSGERFCLRHRPSLTDKLQRARERLAAGEIPCLVTASQARRMELHFIYRFDRKVQAIVTLQNPLTGRTLTGLRWHELRRSENEESLLMSLLGVSFLDREILGRMPVNLRVWYEVTGPGKGERAPGATLILEARLVARLAKYVQEGFDTEPLTLEELTTLLNGYLHEAERSGIAYVVGLASPTGWEPQALEFIASSRVGQAFSHPLVMPCLVDLPRMSLSYDENDERLKGFVALFRPLLLEEEVQLAMEDVRRALVLSPGTLSLAQLREELPQYGEEVILQAARNLEAEGTHMLQDLGNVGLVVSERR